jgi:hypothetical protein
VWADPSAGIDLSAIKNLVAVHRLREVSSLYGFTRFEAAPTSADGEIEDLQLAVPGAPIAKMPIGFLASSSSPKASSSTSMKARSQSGCAEMHKRQGYSRRAVELEIVGSNGVKTLKREDPLGFAAERAAFRHQQALQRQPFSSVPRITQWWTATGCAPVIDSISA